VLTLNGSKLQAVTTDITLATILTVLNLDRNKIDLLAPDIAELEYLEALHLRQNQLATLPWEIGGLVELQFLDLGQNKFKELPGVVGTLTALRTLVLDDNALPKLPNSIGDLVLLERLNIDQNEIALLPPSLPRLTALTLLDVSNNGLKSLPHKLGHMVGLQELYAHNNELTYVPASIETCSNLHTLTFSNNLLTELPYGVSYLTNLTHLSVKNNQISVLSPGLSQNVLLVQFELDDNPIKDPPLLVLQQGFIAVMAYLQRMFDVKTTGHVDLRDLELKDMPADLLGVLGAGDTKTGSRPSTAGSKKGRKTKGPAPIQKLSLTGNKLEYLPAFVGELSSLRELKMDDDLIEPPLHIRNEGISMMQVYLRRIVTAKAQLNLDLRGMLLKEVKLHYYKLESLTSCDLGSNLLTAVPDEVFRYTDLSWLDLSNNLLTQLPRELEVLAGLRQIDARSNQIEHVPAEIFQRSALCTLMLANNRIYALGGPAPAHLRERQSGEDVDAYAEFQKLYKDSFGSKQGRGNGSNGDGNLADVGGGGGGGWGWGELDLGSLQNLVMTDNQLETIPQLAGSAVFFMIVIACEKQCGCTLRAGEQQGSERARERKSERARGGHICYQIGISCGISGPHVGWFLHTLARSRMLPCAINASASKCQLTNCAHTCTHTHTFSHS